MRGVSVEQESELRAEPTSDSECEWRWAGDPPELAEGSSELEQHVISRLSGLVAAGDVEGLREALLVACSAPWQTKAMNTALRTACCQGDAQCLKLLLDANASIVAAEPPAASCGGWSCHVDSSAAPIALALDAALSYRPSDAVSCARLLVERGARLSGEEGRGVCKRLCEVLQREEPVATLERAPQSLARVLADAGASLDVAYAFVSPGAWGAGRGAGRPAETDIVRLALSADIVSLTPLAATCKWDRADVASALVLARADVNARVQMRFLLGTGARAACFAALEVAEALGATRCVELLENVSNGAGQWLAPQLSESTGEEADVEKEAEALAARAAETEADLPWGDPQGMLFAAAKVGDVVRVVRLLREGADPNVPPYESVALTPIRVAAEGGHTEVVRALLQHGAEPNASSGGSLSDQAPLGLAAAAGHLELCALLISAGADVDGNASAGQRVRGQFTPLMQAALFGRAAVVELLLKHGAKPYLRQEGQGGRNALELAQQHRLTYSLDFGGGQSGCDAVLQLLAPYREPDLQTLIGLVNDANTDALDKWRSLGGDVNMRFAAQVDATVAWVRLVVRGTEQLMYHYQVEHSLSCL